MDLTTYLWNLMWVHLTGASTLITLSCCPDDSLEYVPLCPLASGASRFVVCLDQQSGDNPNNDWTELENLSSTGLRSVFRPRRSGRDDPLLRPFIVLDTSTFSPNRTDFGFLEKGWIESCIALVPFCASPCRRSRVPHFVFLVLAS